MKVLRMAYRLATDGGAYHGFKAAVRANSVDV